MSKQGKFLIHCMECYRREKHLTGAAVAALFSAHGLYDYIAQFFESLHVIGDRNITADIDSYIANHPLQP